jgi:hypothetical protein
MNILIYAIDKMEEKFKPDIRSKNPRKKLTPEEVSEDIRKILNRYYCWCKKRVILTFAKECDCKIYIIPTSVFAIAVENISYPINLMYN